MSISENISLAPINKRFFAALIDYAIIFTFTWLYIDAFGKPNDEGGISVSGINALPINVFWFVLTVVFEQMFNSTIGNGIMGIKRCFRMALQSQASNNL